MARVNVYLPDDLAADVKTAELSVSTICQQALTRELRMLQATKDVTFDPEQAAARLKQSEDIAFQEGRALGIRWATEIAPHRGAVQEIARFGPNVPWGLDPDHSLIDFLETAGHADVPELRKDEDEPGDPGVIYFADTPLARGVVAGVVEVWKAIEPLL